MTKLHAWLATEVLSIRGHSVRRWHLHGAALAILIAVAAILVFAVGVFVGYEYPYRTVPAPKLPSGQTAPNPSTCPHTMGGCLPQPHAENAASLTATGQGPDLSNNDPASCSQIAAIAAHNAFLIVKVSEGAGFTDRTAGPMAACARAHRLAVGGYDFLHVCLVTPAAEAHLFIADLRADKLTGKGTLVPTGDAEWPSSPQCNVRSWLQAWGAAVHQALGRWPMIYTGAWWWNPHVGAWWLLHALAWVSGYVPWPPPSPAGRAHIDLWQFTDHGWNGASTGDLSVWRDGVAAFTRATGTPAVQRPGYAIYPARAVLLDRRHISERSTVKAWDHKHCRNPVRRGGCRWLRHDLLALRGRIDHVAHHPLRHGKPTYRLFHRAARRAGINRRLNTHR